MGRVMRHFYGNITYYGIIINSGDIGNLFYGVGGFIRGGTPAALEEILSKGVNYLPSSNRIYNYLNWRKSKDNYIHDSQRKDNNIGGEGVYFRFISKNRWGYFKDMLGNITGTGATAGVFYFIPIRNSVGLEYVHFSASDVAINKSLYFLNNYSKGTNRLKNTNVLKNILKSADSSNNNTEIMFYNCVPFDKITDILITSNYKKEFIQNGLKSRGFEYYQDIEGYKWYRKKESTIYGMQPEAQRCIPTQKSPVSIATADGTDQIIIPKVKKEMDTGNR